MKYCTSGKKPSEIPSNAKIYSEWVSMGDWLGTGNIKAGSLDYLTFNAARRLVRLLNLKSMKLEDLFKCVETIKYPANPDKVYKENEFLGEIFWK